MPDLVKVGFSTKDPELRAKGLCHIGSPHPYVVVYDILIDEPYIIEQRTHKALAAFKEDKENSQAESPGNISSFINLRPCLLD